MICLPNWMRLKIQRKKHNYSKGIIEFLSIVKAREDQELKQGPISMNILRCFIIQNADMVPMVSALRKIMKRPIKRWLCVSRILVAIQPYFGRPLL